MEAPEWVMWEYPTWTVRELRDILKGKPMTTTRDAGFHRQADRVVRGGFTLIEVMLAMVVLSVGLLAIIGNHSTLGSARRIIGTESRAQAMVKAVSERLASDPFTTLGTSVSWSAGRFMDGGLGRAPLTETAVNDQDSLKKQGFLTQDSGVDHLRIYIEYYRGITSFDIPGDVATKRVGMLDGGAVGGQFGSLTGSDSFNAFFKIRAHRDAARLAQNPPSTAIIAGDPMVIRVVALWGDDGVFQDADNDGNDDDAKRMEMFLARRDDSGG